MAMNRTSATPVANGQSTGSLPTMLNAKVMVKSLIRALPYLVIEKFGQTFVLPEHNTKVAKFRRPYLSGQRHPPEGSSRHRAPVRQHRAKGFLRPPYRR